MSGAGKTTIGTEVYKKWKAIDPNTVLVDGDIIRRIFENDRDESDYSLEGRKKNAERIQSICKWLDSQGINVVCNILLIFPEISSSNRELFSEYFEVFLDCPIEILKIRDSKGLYSAASEGREKNVVGVDIPFKPPENPSLVVINAEPPADIDITAKKIISEAMERSSE